MGKLIETNFWQFVGLASRLREKRGLTGPGEVVCICHRMDSDACPRKPREESFLQEASVLWGGSGITLGEAAHVLLWGFRRRPRGGHLRTIQHGRAQ